MIITQHDAAKNHLRQRLFEFDEEQLQQLAVVLCEYNSRCTDTGAQISRLNKKQAYVFVSIFLTTWLPTVQALRNKGRYTVWLGVNPVDTFDSYGVDKRTCINR